MFPEKASSRVEPEAGRESSERGSLRSGRVPSQRRAVRRRRGRHPGKKFRPSRQETGSNPVPA